MDNEPINKPTETENEVLAAIQSGKIKMLPRWRFIVGAVLFAISTIFIFLLLVSLASFIIFSLRETGVWFVPTFGSRGWLAFFLALPWILLLISAVLVVVLEKLIRRYSFANRKPILYSFLAVIVIALLGGIAAAPLHRRPFLTARRGGLPVAGPVYRIYGEQHFHAVYRGVILMTMPGGFVIADPYNVTSTILFTPQTHMFSNGDFAPGDTVVIFGDPQGDVVRAIGIEEIQD